MTEMPVWLCGPTAESLCLALLHSLWQGAVWCVLLLGVLRRIPSDRCETRYAIALACLCGLLGGTSVTWSILRQSGTQGDVQSPVASIVDAGGSSAANAEPIPDASPDRGDEPVAEDVASSTPSLEIARLAPWGVLFWGIGACASLFLSSRHVAALRRFRAASPIQAPEPLRLLAKLVANLNLMRPVQLVSVEGLAVPGIMGVLKPTILIPSTLVTGLTPDQWEAILAHELAHIRRWDYLVNLSQLVIESLLFFNPAVWWLSRQVRFEREACCDAAAVRVTERPFQYAELLVSLAQGLQLKSDEAPLPTLGFSREQPSSLLERVRRIVAPGRRSELTMNRPVAFSYLALGLMAVAMLQTGTDVAVTVAAAIVADMGNDEERVAVLAETADVVQARESEGGLTIRGTISFKGATPPRQLVTVYALNRRGTEHTRSEAGKVDLAKTSAFDVTIGPGITHLQFWHPDCADVFVGPYGAGFEPVVNDVEVVLKPGIRSSVSVVDKNGVPVANAQVTIAPSLQAMMASKAGTALDTNETGLALFPHVDPDLKYSVMVAAPGFQNTYHHRQELRTDRPVRVEIVRERPMNGIVVDQDGTAVAGASVSVKPHRNLREVAGGLLVGQWDQSRAVSDHQGRFTLPDLLDGRRYDILVEADGYALGIIPGVQSGDTGLQAELGAPLTVGGTIHGPIELLQELRHQPLGWKLLFAPQVGDSLALINIGGEEEFHVVDGVGHFALPPLAPGRITVAVGNVTESRELKASLDDLRIDLAPQARVPDDPGIRRIRVTFVRDGQPVSPQGTLMVTGRPADEFVNWTRPYPVDNGAVEAAYRVPQELDFSSNGLVGFWFRTPARTAEIPTGEERADIVIPVEPAGAAKGIVLNADGSPALDARASVGFDFTEEDFSPGNRSAHEPPDLPDKAKPVYHTFAYGSPRGDAYCTGPNLRGESFLTPIPFGVTCYPYAMRGMYLAIGDSFVMNAENAYPTFTVELGKGIDARIRLLDPSGAPIANRPVELRSQHPEVPMIWGNQENTDEDGECRFQGLNSDLEGHYVVKIEFDKDYATMTVPLKLNGETTVIRTKRVGESD